MIQNAATVEKSENKDFQLAKITIYYICEHKKSHL